MLALLACVEDPKLNNVSQLIIRVRRQTADIVVDITGMSSSSHVEALCCGRHNK